MTSDETIVLKDTDAADLTTFCEMEREEAGEFVIAYSLAKHQDEFAQDNVVYKSIYQGDELVGFVILALEPDGRSVEFRRIVVAKPGYGVGQRAVTLVRQLCRHELGRDRIWLDVFETNSRARHVYEKSGYQQFGEAEHAGRKLLLYQTTA